MVDTPLARPRIVAWLGYGGLLPFLALGVLTWVDRERVALWHGMLCAYGAVILSFVGALHWGFAMLLEGIPASARTALFAWSVIPCLMAFVSLALHSLLGDILLVAGFAMHYSRDLRLAASAPMPEWYLPLRLRLSVVAILCIAAGALAFFK